MDIECQCFKCGFWLMNKEAVFWFKYEKMTAPVCPNCFFKEITDEEFSHNLFSCMSQLLQEGYDFEITKEKTVTVKNG